MTPSTLWYKLRAVEALTINYCLWFMQKKNLVNTLASVNNVKDVKETNELCLHFCV